MLTQLGIGNSRMRIVEKVLARVAPHSCLICKDEGSVLCDSCADGHLQTFGERCAGCNKLNPGSKTCDSCRSVDLPTHIYTAVVYNNVASKLIYKYKFDHQRQSADVMVRLMAELVQNTNDYIVVPVPTATKRVRERGFDNSKFLARKLASKHDWQYRDAINRIGQKSQVGAGRNERLIQSKTEYYLRNLHYIRGKKFLLVDDVMTTGGTLIACTKTLRSAGARNVDAVVFAKKI